MRSECKPDEFEWLVVFLNSYSLIFQIPLLVTYPFSITKPNFVKNNLLGSTNNEYNTNNNNRGTNGFIQTNMCGCIITIEQV